MPATIAVTGGTWTSFPFDRTINPKTGPNVRAVEDLNLTQFNSGLVRGPSPNMPELDQFIQLMADNLAISNQTARTLIHTLTKVTLQRGEPVAREYTP
jgi:hypothetical protein